jgi:error-prone DNA polymerase
MSDYAELHCISNFSFLRGASHPEELVRRAAGLGYAALAITDECSVAGVVRAHLATKEHGLKLIVGSELRVGVEEKSPKSPLTPLYQRGEQEGGSERGGQQITSPPAPLYKGGSRAGGEENKDGELRVVLLATDREGYGNLCELITRGRRAADKGEYHLTRTDLEAGLPGCLVLWLPGEEPDAEAGAWLAERFPGACWIALELLRTGSDRERLRALQDLGEELSLPLVAAGDVHMHRRGRRALQDTLTAIRLGTPLAELGHELYPNGERHLRAREVLAGLYPAELLAETVAVAERCRFSLDELRYEYPEELVPEGRTASQWLRELTEQGMRRRWPEGVPEKVRRLVEHELALIAELAYEPYFLTVQDIVAFARSRAILCQGRGSAANSAVCFCLGITEVDPARMDLLFERFISKERDEPPDIDVDFENDRREEVIQYIYAKYGRERAALAATLITYRPKSAVRDVGKALGLSLEQVDRLAKSHVWWDGREVSDAHLRENGFDPANPVLRRVLALTNLLIGFPRHLSQHVGGFVIARDRLSRLVPIENAAMAERTVIQWDKDDLEALGLLKVDCLALGMLAAIRRSLDLIREYRGRSLTLATVPAEDPTVYRMLQHGDSVGVFQVESRAQMAMLPRLKPASFYDLVIEVAIVRPGPIQGDMVHPYLRRRQGIEAVEYPSEAVRETLERTLGVPIFQEQVIKLATVAAGFTAGEADHLRRSIAGWRRRGGLEPFRERLVRGMCERGYSEDFAERIYQQILGFGEYGFPESHAASFALLVYVSAWLKRHEPAAFVCGLLNAQPMGFYAPSQLIQDARRHGVTFRDPDVAVSAWDGTLEPERDGEPAVRLGLRLVRGLSQEAGERIVAARAQHPFADTADLVHRADLDRRDREALAAAGALASLAGNRHRVRWAVAGVEDARTMFEGAEPGEGEPLLRRPTEAEDILADYAAKGLTLGRHPLAVLRPWLEGRDLARSDCLAPLPHGTPVHVGGLVTCRQRPGTASGVVFLTLEDECGFCNVVVWGHLADRQRRELLGARLMGVVGEVQRQGEVIHVIAERLEDHTDLLGRLHTESRDFH